MKQASRALVCKRRDGRHSCCAAVLIKTCSPHNVSTPVPNTTRSLSHNVHACKEAAAAANKQKKQLPINLKYDTCIVKSTNREEETEKIPFSGRGKTEGRVGYSDIEKAETEAARAATPGNIASVVPRRYRRGTAKQILHSTRHFWATSLMGAYTKWTVTNVG